MCMYVRTDVVTKSYIRKSKRGKTHPYIRRKTMVVFKCDECDEEFIREKGKVDPRRLNNNYFHVCPKCDPKRFAQKKGVEKRLVWDWKVSSDMDISKI